MFVWKPENVEFEARRVGCLLDAPQDMWLRVSTTGSVARHQHGNRTTRFVEPVWKGCRDAFERLDLPAEFFRACFRFAGQERVPFVRREAFEGGGIDAFIDEEQPWPSCLNGQAELEQHEA